MKLGQVRRPLWWGLALTLGLTLAALNRHAEEPVVVGATERSPIRQGDEAARVVGVALPAVLSRFALAAAKRDPFLMNPLMETASTPKRPLAIQVPLQVAAPASTNVATTAPPELTHRFLGELTDPQGQRLVFMAQGDTAVPVQVGTLLKDGYAVKAIEENSIELVHAASQTQALVRRWARAERPSP